LIAIAVPFSLCKIGDMLSVAPLTSSDIAEIVAAFVVFGWGGKDRAQYEGYLLEQGAGVRDVLVARSENTFVGYVTVKWWSDYPPFRNSNIPEVQDLNVLPQHRRKRIGTRLTDEAERLISPRSPIVGIGVGLHSDYGAAQRLYVLRGYVPDARGITSHGKQVMLCRPTTISFSG
jgi:ribosomal protein S18 acetylase RimI-like enzyme